VARGIRGTGDQYARAGMVVTAGGLVFIGTADHKLRAYDEDNGKVVWEKEVSGPINGVPAIYELDGRQYVTICVGAAAPVAGAAGPQSGSEYVVFALKH
jgi:quinoprotein glucose dehydrogenase